MATKNATRWKQAINMAVTDYKDENVSSGKALDAIAMRLVKAALYEENYSFAVSEIGNRLDGKSTEHKVIDSTTTERYEGVSEALGILRKFAGEAGEELDEGAVSH